MLFCQCHYQPYIDIIIRFKSHIKSKYQYNHELKLIGNEVWKVRKAGWHGAMQWRTNNDVLFYSILFLSITLYSTLLYSTLPYSTLPYSTLLFSTLLYSTQHFSVGFITFDSDAPSPSASFPPPPSSSPLSLPPPSTFPTPSSSSPLSPLTCLYIRSDKSSTDAFPSAHPILERMVRCPCSVVYKTNKRMKYSVF